jgi:predicted DNA-binding ribbon-helix-helix protein
MSKSLESGYAESNEYELKSTLVSRNITVFNRRTSIRLEPEMWMALREIAKREQCSIHDLCTLIGVRKNENTSLTAAIRVFLMLYFRSAATEAGHSSAGHGSFENMMRRARVPGEYLGYFKTVKPRAEELPPSSPVTSASVGAMEQNNSASAAAQQAL